MSPDGMWSIGELAERAGVTVKTVRFYSDRGLLPETSRSSGGHRRYGSDALDRLRLIRSLRALDLPVPEVGRVLDHGDGLADTLEEAVDGRLRELGSQLTALRWREAALQLVRDCPAEERADRLRLVGAVSAPPGTAALARFWRGALPVRLSRRLVSSILEHAVPQPPADPTPAQVLAFARLHAIATAPCPTTDPRRPAGNRTDEGCRPDVLYRGLFDAYTLAAADLRANRAPDRGQTLDCFVAAHAESRGLRDGPEFRRRLTELLALAADPMVERYWELAGELSGSPEPTLGAAHAWMRAALAADVAAAADRTGHARPVGGVPARP
ncbi:MerR family transcriptional regulator [Streptacidiphilus sp. ASG 303]|uniref:helix-turn-helix domain-containing protein n=1 Tax=Streptacidiphilus sp. ASG 303 TaxID=2896847 RepID=UPI001E524E42|nr:MerR family transcriptional regulator [Streptacidiphilus sp. ASG 303]MCD0485407.1 MerR family transcriptional regulator [Streptacidiphilus sp. ASG 303]